MVSSMDQLNRAWKSPDSRSLEAACHAGSPWTIEAKLEARPGGAFFFTARPDAATAVLHGRLLIR
jgi:hypothetical protein